jgi:pimeloyl-ACP methyl ester carboxylesterase
MRLGTVIVAAVAVFAHGFRLSAQRLPSAVYSDPPRDSAHPARMEVLHIPSGGVKINGVAYVAAGAGAHPTFVFFHGLPGNEKNLDLAQAVRRAGWNAITINYRGSWGSPGVFRFAGNLEDASATLTFLRDSTNARALGVDTRKIVIAGHSMGGWVTAIVASAEPNLAGAVLISAADMARMADAPREGLATMMADNMESLAGVTAQSMADDAIALGAARGFNAAAASIRVPLLVLTSDDGLAPASDDLVARARAAGNTRITAIHRATDHGWSDSRIALESAVINWLQQLP